MKRTAAQLSQGGAVCVIGKIHDDAFKLGLELRLERNVVKIEVVGVENNGTSGIDAAGNDNADPPQIRLGAALGFQQAADLCGNLPGDAFAIRMRKRNGAASNDIQRFIHQSDFDIGTTDVHTDLVHGNHFLARFVNHIIVQNRCRVKENVP